MIEDKATEFLMRRLDGRSAEAEERHNDAIAHLVAATSTLEKEEVLKMLNTSSGDQGTVKLSQESKEIARRARGGGLSQDEEADAVAWLVQSMEVN